MKNSFYLLSVALLFSVLFFSCNKDDTVSSNGGNTNTGPVTQTYTSNPNRQIEPTSWTLDSLSATTTGINATSVSGLKLNLNTLENVTMSNLRFVLAHNGTEVLMIDNITNLTTQGNITNLVLWDSAAASIMTVNGYPITGTYRPLNQLSGFYNFEASGYWTLKIYNSGSLRTGVIKSWGITITYRTVQPSSNVIVPTAVGNTWITEKRDTNGVLQSYDTVYIPFSATYQNKTVYYIYRGYNATDSIYARNESDGLWVYDLTHNQSGLVWKYPINTGEKYFQFMNQDTITCLSNNQTVMTPMGQMTGCVVYGNYDMGLLVHTEIFKPNFGIIGGDDYYNGVLVKTERIIYYHLNK
jgi:hypothetical protein